MATVDPTYDPEDDATYLYNQLRAVPVEQRKPFAQAQIDALDSNGAAAATPIADIVYMRRVWKDVIKRLDDDAKPKLETVTRNVRYSKRFSEE